MRKYEHYDKDGCFHTWRIVPTFMQSGVRVFHEESNKDTVCAFGDMIFKNSEAAERRIERMLSYAMETKQIFSYTVKEV